MHPAIQKALESQRFFKLICGASYRNTQFVANLARIFASAGAHVIDIGAKAELVQAVKTGLAQATPPVPELPLIMVSVGINSDVHFLRVEKEFERCDSHGLCANACPHEVFVGNEIRLENCLGCDYCVVACPEDALTLVPRDPMTAMDDILKACFEAGATALEVHTGDGNRSELEAFIEKLRPWQEHLQLLAFSVGAHGQSQAEIVALAKDIEAQWNGPIIIQADGKPISGRKGKKSTLPSLELAQALFDSGLQSYVQVSGGTNNLTGQVAQEEGIPIHGVGMGSFARKFVDLSPSDKITPAMYARAVDRAQMLLQSIQCVNATV